jgi:hypothetical protein
MTGRQGNAYLGLCILTWRYRASPIPQVPGDVRLLYSKFGGMTRVIRRANAGYQEPVVLATTNEPLSRFPPRVFLLLTVHARGMQCWHHPAIGLSKWPEVSGARLGDSRAKALEIHAACSCSSHGMFQGWETLGTAMAECTCDRTLSSRPRQERVICTRRQVMVRARHRWSLQRCKQRLSLLQVGGIKAFREPAIALRQHLPSCCLFALALP